MKRLCAVSAACAMLALSCSKEQEVEVAPKISPAAIYLNAVIERAENARTNIDAIVAAAEAAAADAVKGGMIYVTDDETVSRTGEEKTKMIPGGGVGYPMHEDWGGFVAEACDRAGGLRHIQPVPLNNQVSENDIIMVGTAGLRPQEQMKQIKALKDQGALVILFGSSQSDLASIADFVIDNGLTPGVHNVLEIGSYEKTGPVAPMANVINEWAFTAEYVAALTRLGKMPTCWQSMFVPGAAERNTHIGEYLYHPDMEVNPKPAGDSARQYLGAVLEYLTKIRENELDNFKEAGTLCAGSLSSGHKVVASVLGHFMVAQFRMPGYPDLFDELPNQYGREYLDGKLSAGDTWLHVGYSYTPVVELELAREVGASTVAVFTPGPSEVGEGTPIEPDMSRIDVYIDPYWKHGDAVVDFPGYDIRICPPSGVVMITSYWMILGETMAAMTR